VPELALEEARWDAALDELLECEDWPLEIAEYAVLVKADALMRRDAAIGLVVARRDQRCRGDGCRSLPARTRHRARAHERAEFHRRRPAFRTRRALLASVPGGAPKLAYNRSRVRWMRREARPDDADFTLALTDPDPTGRASAYAVRSWAHASAGEYRLQIADLVSALEVAAAADYRCDVASLGIIVHTLARASFEIADARGLPSPKRHSSAFAGPTTCASTSSRRCECWGSMHSCAARLPAAQWLFRDAAVTAPTPAFEVLAHLDRAYVARIMRNEPWALDELYEAVRIARGVHWGQTFGEERLALVVLAVLLAPTNAAEAQRFAAMYSMLGVESVSPVLALAHERRALASEKYALGCIERTLGNVDAARAALQEAYDVFDPIDYHYRAMLVASTLAELTGEAAWSERAKRHLAHYPGTRC
jgi:tetratricopeptide (TPR) repeat protein